jgi:hypothetical protein
MRLRFIEERSVEFLHFHRGITCDDRIPGYAFGHNGSGSNDGIVADGDAFQNYGVHSDPDVVANFDRRDFKFGTRRAIFEERRQRPRVDETLSRFEWMKIGIGDANAPRNQTMRTDLDEFFGHDNRSIEQREIADGASTILLDRKRTPSVNGNMIAENDSVRFFAQHFFENLRALAVKAFAEIDVGWNRFRIPIVPDAPISFDVAHVGNFPEVNNFA